MGSLVWAAIAPHGDLAIAEAVAADKRDLARSTQAGMRELARRFDVADPSVVVVLSPHNIHVEGHFAVITAGSAAGRLDEDAEPISLTVPIDRELGSACLDELRAASLPALGVSYGGNVAAEAVMPLDWGSLIPLWYLGRRASGSLPTVLIVPARDRLPGEHVAAGAAIARAIRASASRVALVASCDQSHAHAADGPYGFHERSSEFDQLVVDAIRHDELGRLTEVPADLIEDAKPDSWWQMLMLHGALGAGWRAELVSYEAPTYYGMLCASFEPMPSG